MVRVRVRVGVGVGVGVRVEVRVRVRVSTGGSVTRSGVRDGVNVDRRSRVGPVVVAVARAQRLAAEVIVLSEDSG